MGETANNAKAGNVAIRNVFMAKMAYLIPIPRMRRHYRDKDYKSLKAEIPFVHHLNAIFAYCPYLSDANPIKFSYESKYDGYHICQRTIGITPYLLRYKFGNQMFENRAIVLIASLDKHFNTGDHPILDKEWCTPFDLVYFRKAICETDEHGLFTNGENGPVIFQEWLKSRISEVSDIRKHRVEMPKMFSSSNITIVGIDETLVDIEEVNKQVKEQYYEPTNYKTIDDFLSINIIDRGAKSYLTDARCFVHGFLLCNNNFMQLHNNSVKETLSDYYSNNRVEGYWAVEDNILSIKVASPFTYIPEADRHDRIIKNTLEKTDCLMELCILGMLDMEIEHFYRNLSKMESHEIELRRAQIAEYLNERLLNLWEMDHRMDYFIKRFRLNERFRRLLEAAVPRSNARNVVFNRTGSFVSWVIAFLAMIATILTLLKK